jgi:hypothetical protein
MPPDLVISPNGGGEVRRDVGNNQILTRAMAHIDQARGFLDSCLKPRPSFNDGSPTKEVPVAIDDGMIEMVHTLRKHEPILKPAHGG